MASGGGRDCQRDVAALVSSASLTEVQVQLVNLSAFEERSVIVQAGSFAQDRFRKVSWTRRTSEYPGRPGSGMAPALEVEAVEQECDEVYLEVVLPPGTEIELRLQVEKFTQRPSY